MAASMSTALSIKASCEEDIRRITAFNRELTFDELCFMMHRLFRDRLSSNVSNLILKYRDSEGDLVTILDSVDITNALEDTPVLRIVVYDKEVLPVPRIGTSQLLGLEDDDGKLKKTLADLRSQLDKLIEALDQRPAKAKSAPASTAAAEPAPAPTPVAAVPQTKPLSREDMQEFIGGTGATKQADQPKQLQTPPGAYPSPRPAPSPQQPQQQPQQQMPQYGAMPPSGPPKEPQQQQQQHMHQQQRPQNYQMPPQQGGPSPVHQGPPQSYQGPPQGLQGPPQGHQGPPPQGPLQGPPPQGHNQGYPQQQYMQYPPNQPYPGNVAMHPGAPGAPQQPPQQQQFGGPYPH